MEFLPSGRESGFKVAALQVASQQSGSLRVVVKPQRSDAKHPLSKQGCDGDNRTGAVRYKALCVDTSTQHLLHYYLGRKRRFECVSVTQQKEQGENVAHRGRSHVTFCSGSRVANRPLQYRIVPF